jgi:CRISPR/Cas system-associated exonuclease Cas4 (RecB family)
MDTIKAWSFSGLMDYEACPLRAKFRYINKIKTESAPAAQRGTELHLIAEYIVKKDENLRAAFEEEFPDSSYHDRMIEFNKALNKGLLQNFTDWQDAYSKGNVILEEQWGMTSDWEPCDFYADDVWWRGMLDLLELNDNRTHGWVVDHKSGKKYGNEVKHAQQGQLYAFIAFMMYPSLETVTAQMCYLDLGEFSRPLTYTKQQAAKIGARFTERAELMTTDTTFRSKPNKYNCRWCNFKEKCDAYAPM